MTKRIRILALTLAACCAALGVEAARAENRTPTHDELPMPNRSVKVQKHKAAPHHMRAHGHHGRLPDASGGNGLKLTRSRKF